MKRKGECKEEIYFLQSMLFRGKMNLSWLGKVAITRTIRMFLFIPRDRQSSVVPKDVLDLQLE